MKLVRMLGKFPPYQVGEVAGFADPVADGLIAEGRAALVEEKKPEAADGSPVDKAHPKGARRKAQDQGN